MVDMSSINLSVVSYVLSFWFWNKSKSEIWNLNLSIRRACFFIKGVAVQKSELILKKWWGEMDSPHYHTTTTIPPSTQTHLPSQAASNLRLCYKNINKQTKNNKMTSKHLDCDLIVISHWQDRQSSPKLKFQGKALTK